MARTAPGWSLLIRPLANLASQGGYALYEGLVETDHWFGPLFTNLRFTRTDAPIHLASGFPLAQIQAVPRHIYDDDTLNSLKVTPTLAALTSIEWDAYRKSVVEPNSRPNRSFGEYAVAARKRRRKMCPT